MTATSQRYRADATSAIWEHDNCQCPSCLHPATHERLEMVVDPGDGPHGPGPVPHGPDPATVAVRPITAEVPTLPHESLAAPDGLERWLTTLLEVLESDSAEMARLKGRV